MKKFKFRLERVLKHRQMVTGERRRDLARANLALFSAESQLGQLKQEQVRKLLPESGSYDAGMAQLAAQYQVRLEVEILFQQRNVEQAQEGVRAAVAAYTAAKTDERALDTLRERKLQEYIAVAQKAEMAFLDEMATQRHALRRTGHGNNEDPATSQEPEKN